MFTHINWGGRYRITVVGDTILVDVCRWGGQCNGLTQKIVGWRKRENFPAEDMMYFHEV